MIRGSGAGFRLSLATKVRLVIASVVGMTLIAVTAALYTIQRDAIETATQARAVSLASALAAYASDYLYFDQIDESRMMAKRTLQEPGIVEVLVVDGFGFIVANGNSDSDRLFEVVDDPLLKTAIETRETQFEFRHDISVSIAPSLIEQDSVGAIVLTTSLDGMRAQLRTALQSAALAGLIAMAAAMLASHFFINHMRKPLERLLQGATKVAQGEIDHRLDINSRDELEDVGEAFNHMLDQLQSAQEHTERLAHTDQLTGLPNRFGLRFILKQLTSAGGRNRQIGLMFIDLDKFKLVNDTFGHDVGDKLLEHFAATVTATLAAHNGAVWGGYGKIDRPVLARIGGDEFTLILPSVEDEASVASLAGEIIDRLDRPVRIAERDLRIGTSIGIALEDPAKVDGDEILRRADMAMYAAKTSGRGRFAFFASEMESQTADRVWIEHELRHALLDGAFSLFAQPQFASDSLRPIGVELLARWNHPDRGWISPGKFIPVAEESGLILSLGKWVFEQGCEWAKRWREMGFDLRVGINFSGQQIDQPDFVEEVRGIVSHSGADPRCIEIELTESTLMERPEETALKLAALRRLGMQVAIDDFGTGYSSLGQLKQLPFDRLKIDQSFVRDLPDDRDDLAITTAIAGLGHSLGYSLIAEGVETDAQLQFLRTLNCEEVQGFLLARPMPIEDVADWLRQYDRRAADRGRPFEFAVS